MEPTLEEAVDEWHASVDAGDLQGSAGAVGDPVVVLGPKGAGPITPARLAEKVTAALRLPDLKAALELAYICREMAATE